MSEPQPLISPDDSAVVREVRAARERLWVESGSSFRGLFDRLRKNEDARKAAAQAAAKVTTTPRRKSA